MAFNANNDIKLQDINGRLLVTNLVIPDGAKITIGNLYCPAQVGRWVEWVSEFLQLMEGYPQIGCDIICADWNVTLEPNDRTSGRLPPVAIRELFPKLLKVLGREDVIIIDVFRHVK